MNIKSILKRKKFLYTINVYYKAFLVKKRYNLLKKYYEKRRLKQHNLPEVNNILRKRNLKPLSKGSFRIIYVGTDPGQDFGGIIQGLRKFGEVIYFERGNGIYGQLFPSGSKKDVSIINGKRLYDIVQNVLKNGPVHVVIGQMWGFTMDNTILNKIRELGIPVVNIAMDDRHAFKGRKVDGKWTGTYGLIGAIDLACTTAKECCEWYLLEGCPAIYLPPASDPDLYKPLSVPKEYDVCFVGANYGIRSKIIKAISKKGIRVICYGKGWPNGRIDIKDLPELFAKSRIVLGVGTIGHCTDFYALKMRDFDGPMSGSLYITHDNPDLYELYDVGKEIITYRNPQECAKKVRYYIDHPNEAEAIARAGRARAEKEHTWEKRFEKLLKTIGLLER